MSRRRQRGGDSLNAWPGYVDALSTLLMVIIFVLLVFVLAQGFLSVALSSRDRALDRLNRQVAELAEMLSMERGQSEGLREQLSRAVEDARNAAQARDAAQAQIATLREQASQAGSERDSLRAERDRLSARLADLDVSARGGAGRIDSLEQRLAEALTQAEAAGGENARTVRDLTEARRALATERQALEQARQDAVTAAATLKSTQDSLTTAQSGRSQAETDLATTRTALTTERDALAAARRDLAEAQASLEAMRREMESLNTTVKADRETIEARLADLARLTEQIRALTALRDQLEQRNATLITRAEAAEKANQDSATTGQGTATALEAEARRREAAEGLTAEANRRAEAVDTARRAAEGQGAEYARLAESARAQVALLTQQVQALRAEIARVSAILDAEEKAGRDKDAQITLLGQRLNAALASRVEELQRYRSDFFGRLRNVIGDRQDVRIVGDRFVFQGEVLFQAGSADLSDAGQQQIRSLARVLLDIAKQIPPEVNWLLRVDGHADRSPIRPGARFASNWELSSARAIAVAQMLIADGLPPERVAAAAFGEFQPIDTTDSAEARQRNRRIEFRLTDR